MTVATLPLPYGQRPEFRVSDTAVSPSDVWPEMDDSSDDIPAVVTTTVEVSPKAQVWRELSGILSLANTDDWAGPNTEAISSLTFSRAVEFFHVLPADFPLPEVSAEPSGWIAFDWRSDDDEYLLSVSVKHGRDLAWNGIFHDGDLHGFQQFGHGFPVPLLPLIRRVYSVRESPETGAYE